MKIYIVTTFLIIAIAGRAAAQEKFSAPEFSQKLGKTGTLCDTIYSLKIVNDTLTFLYMGGAYPNQKYSVVIRGTKVNLNWTNLKGKPLCVTGVFELYKGRPAIEIVDPKRINIDTGN